MSLPAWKAGPSRCARLGPEAVRRLGDFVGVNDREVDVGLRDDVEEVGEDVLGDDGDDLDDLAVAEAGVADRRDVGVGDVAALCARPCRRTRRRAFALASPDSPLRLSAISSGLIFARFRPR